MTKTTILTAALAALACAPAMGSGFAAPAGFAPALLKIEAGALAGKAQSAKAADAALAGNIAIAAENAQTLDRQAWQLRDELSELRGQAEAGRSPMLQAQLQQAASEMSIILSNVNYVGSEINNLIIEAAPDPAAVSDAQNLEMAAERFASMAQWLNSEALLDQSVFSAAGAGAQAMEIQMDAQQIDSGASEIQSLSSELLSKVRPAARRHNVLKFSTTGL
ncbi:MAG: hypothetical protein KGI84_03370 [Elusimicrobia bacterium]|nr:hypothetical protein [Elusimicrobiota bacterium]